MALSLDELRDETRTWTGERVGAGHVEEDPGPPPEGHTQLGWEGVKESMRYLCAQVEGLLSAPPDEGDPAYPKHQEDCAVYKHQLATFCVSMRERNCGRGPDRD